LMRTHHNEPAELVRAVWMAVLSRPPLPEEARDALGPQTHNRQAAKQAVDDLVWALVNSKEFLYRH
jgi:hypothetical protein